MNGEYLAQFGSNKLEEWQTAIEKQIGKVTNRRGPRKEAIRKGERTPNQLQELKNICNRCGKVWYLGSGELEDLENRFKIAQKGMEGQLRVELVTSLFDPMLAAQMGGGSMAGLRPVQRLREELMEKSRCPECQSKHVERVLVDADETISGKKATTFGREQQGVIKKKIVEKESSGSLADELKKLNELKEQGILDEEEFKTAKRKLLENQ